MSADPAPVRVIYRGYRQWGIQRRAQKEVDGSFPSVNDIGVDGRWTGKPNHTYNNAKHLYSMILAHLLTGESGTEVEFIKPGTQNTKIILPVERDGELPHPMGSVLVEAVCCYPSLQTRDQQNIAGIIWKFVGDVLTANGWLENDDWTRYLCGNCERALDRNRPAYTELVFLPSLKRRVIEDRTEQAGALF